MIKKSLAQLLNVSNKASVSQHKGLGQAKFATSPIRSSPKSPSSGSAFSLAKTQRPKGRQSDRRSGNSATRSTLLGDKGRKRVRDISSTIQVPAHKRLRACQVKPITLGRYKDAVGQLEKWALRNRRSLSQRVCDRTIVEYLQYLCEAGGTICTARSTVFGFILLKCDSHLPERFLLPQSKAALKGWVLRFPTHSRAAVDVAVWYVVAHQCLMTHDINSAAAILLQGDMYLRPSELLALTKSSVLRPSASRARCWGVVVGQQEMGIPTKTKCFDDCVLLDSISRDDLSFVLKFLFQRAKGSGEKLFQGLTLGAYNRAISDASRVLQIQSLKLTAHGLRHAGPSSDSLHRRRDINAIQQRGRWAAPSSVARYRKPGRMLLLHQQVPATVWNQSEKAYAKVISFFKSRSQRKNA